MRGCANCGLRVNDQCYVNRRRIKPGDHELFKDCSYFIEPVIEDGRVLEPAQLLLLAENKIQRRK
jgi:hypothetical protein